MEIDDAEDRAVLRGRDTDLGLARVLRSIEPRGRAVGHPERNGLDPELRLAARHRRHSVKTDDRLAGSVVRGDNPPDPF